MSVRLTFRGQIYEIEPDITLQLALEKIGIDPGSVLAIRQGNLITEEEILVEKDEVKLVSVISGGAVPTAAVLVVSAYIAAQMLSDIASLKIGVVFKLAVDMGTFIYPITFTLRDVVHKILGKRNAQVLIVTAGVINLIMAAYLMWAASVPSDPSWNHGVEFSAILAPVWRIVLASIAAEVLSELTDTEIYQWFVTKITRRYQWLRVLISNSISIPVDNLVFAVGAFAITLPWNVVWQIFIFNLLIKYGMTLVSLPLIYLSPQDRD